MSFQPIRPKPIQLPVEPMFVSFRVGGQIALSQSLREAMEEVDATHLEIEYDAVDERMRFKPSKTGIRLRYNIVSVPKATARHFTYYSDLGVYRTRRHKVEQADDGWWYIINSPRTWRESRGLGKDTGHPRGRTS